MCIYSSSSRLEGAVVADNRAANRETLKILILPKKSSKEELKLKIASKLVQYHFISICAHLYVLYISMSCPFYLSLLKLIESPFILIWR